MPISAPEYPSVLRASSIKSLLLSSCGVEPTLSSNILNLAFSSGRGMYILFSNLQHYRLVMPTHYHTHLLLIAWSSDQGRLVAPNTKIPLLSTPTPEREIIIPMSNHDNKIPSIWTRNSVFILLVASCSPSLRAPHIESTSSMKMIAGLLARAISNKFFTSLQEKRSHDITWYTVTSLPFTLPKILWHQVWWWNGKESWVSLSSDCFG